jgi:hypothetical protein
MHMAHEICGLAADWLHALEDLFEGREMFFLILLGDPIGHRKHFAVAGGGKRKADGGRSPLLAVATPGDAFPFQAGGRVARRSRIDSDMLPPTEDFPHFSPANEKLIPFVPRKLDNEITSRSLSIHGKFKPRDFKSLRTQFLRKHFHRAGDDNKIGIRCINGCDITVNCQAANQTPFYIRFR